MLLLALTAVREVREETGVEVEITGIVGLYTNPGHVMAYDDGEVRQQFSICFTGRGRHDHTNRRRRRDIDSPAPGTGG